MNVAKWEFDCPQFVDFEAGLESSVTEVWLENETDHRKTLTTSSLPCKARMATPKINLHKSIKTSPFVKASGTVKTDDEKIASISRLPRRYSKSDSCLNRPVEAWISPEVKLRNKTKKFHRKRSMSENNIKKRILPVTPMCLKRTLKKTANKGKTSEEIEMDKINELQNKLKQQLRLNEVNLKRMKSNKAPYPAQKVLIQKSKTREKTMAVKGTDQPLQLQDMTNRKIKQDFNAQALKENRSEALRLKSRKLQSVLDSVFKTEAPSNVLRAVNGDKGQRRKRFDDHCGLKFFPNQEKTVPRPFSFDTSSVSQNGSFCFKEIKADAPAYKTPNPFSGKENFFRPVSIRKERK